MAISKEQLASIISGRAKHLCNPEGDRLVEGYTKNNRGGSYDPNPSSYDNDADAFDRMYLSSYDDSSRITNNDEYTSISATNSRMPEDIKRSMLEHRIDTSALSSTSVLDSLGIKPQRAEKRRQQVNENVSPVHQSQNNAVDYSISLPSELGSSESTENIVTTGTISNMNAKKKKTTKGHILGYHMRQK